MKHTYARATIWFAAFLEMRELLGQADADRTLAQVWQAARVPKNAPWDIFPQRRNLRGHFGTKAECLLKVVGWSGQM
jgi:hypothetical protein